MDHPDLMTSTEKVIAALAHLDGLDAAELDPQASALVLALTMLRPQVIRMLPEDPAELDALLLKGSAWALALRSDDTLDPYILEPVEVIDAIAAVATDPEPAA
jgi:hypothetical protein